MCLSVLARFFMVVNDDFNYKSIMIFFWYTISVHVEHQSWLEPHGTFLDVLWSFLVKDCANFTVFWGENDQSVEPKILKFMIERWGSICADSVRYTQLVVTDTGDVINTLSVVVILLIYSLACLAKHWFGSGNSIVQPT